MRISDWSSDVCSSDLDALRLPDAMLTHRRNYLDSLHFATNLVLFREGGGHHTRLATANYWSAYGAKAPSARCCLMDEPGRPLAEWSDPLPGANASVVVAPPDGRRRFDPGASVRRAQGA